MWLWTIDEKLLNLNQVETIELIDVYDFDAESPEDFLDQPEATGYEIIAFLASDREVSLFYTEDNDLALQAYELLATFIGTQDIVDGFTQGQVLSLEGLLKKVSEGEKN